MYMCIQFFIVVVLVVYHTKIPKLDVAYPRTVRVIAK